MDVAPVVMETLEEKKSIILNQINYSNGYVSTITTITVPADKILTMFRNIVVIDNFDRSILNDIDPYNYRFCNIKQIDLLVASITRVDDNVICTNIPIDTDDLKTMLNSKNEILHINPDLVVAINMAMSRLKQMNQEGYRAYYSSINFMPSEIGNAMFNQHPEIRAKHMQNPFEFDVYLKHGGTMLNIYDNYEAIKNSPRGESFNRPSMVPPGFIPPKPSIPPTPPVPPTPPKVSFSAPPKQPTPIFKTTPFPANGQSVVPGTPIPPPMPMGRDYMPLVLKQQIKDPQIPVVFVNPKQKEQEKQTYASPDHVGGILNAILSSDNSNVTNGAVGAFVNGDGQIMLSYEDGSISPPINNQLVGIKYEEDDDEVI